MSKCLIVILFVFCNFQLISQVEIQTPNFCENREAFQIEASHPEVFTDSLYVVYSEDSLGLHFQIINSTNNVHYLFNSYIKKEYYRSMYVHRINRENHLYKFSFTPIVHLLYTRKRDVVVIDFSNPVAGNQNVYDFIRLQPNSYYEIDVNYQDLFAAQNSQDNAVSDFDPKQLGIDDNLIKITTKNLSGFYNSVFEFALYEDISLLCDVEAYYLREYEFRKQASSYKTLALPVTICFYKHPIIFRSNCD